MSVVLWFILVVVTAVVCFILYPEVSDYNSRIGNIWRKMHSKVIILGKVVLWGWFVIVCMSPLYYEFPEDGSTVVTFEENRVIRHRFGAFCWEFSNSYSNMPTAVMKISSGVTFLTENPKVRHLHYSVQAIVSNPDFFYGDARRRINKSGSPLTETNTTVFSYSPGESIEKEVNMLVIAQLFEFNNRFSKQLAGFYNPLDAKQQQEFKRLLEPWLNAQLAKDGIRVVAYNFGIE